MNGPTLKAVILGSVDAIEGTRDELRALDAALGDGDLGITVGDGILAVRVALDALDDAAGPSEVLRTAAVAFATANPSTFSALVSAGLLAAARELTGRDVLDRPGAIALLATATSTIQSRGKAEPGDKTVVDPLLASLAVLRDGSDDARQTLGVMTEAARASVDATAATESKRGRAAWVGERSAGHPDGGGTAYIRLLEALGAAWPSDGA